MGKFSRSMFDYQCNQAIQCNLECHLTYRLLLTSFIYSANCCFCYKHLTIELKCKPIIKFITKPSIKLLYKHAQKHEIC